MLKQTKLMIKLREQYLLFIDDVFNDDISNDYVIASYNMFIGMANAVVLVVSKRNRKVVYQHITRANKLFNEKIHSDIEYL